MVNQLILGSAFFFLLAAPAQALTEEVRKIEKQIESLGTPVLWIKSHPLCGPGLLGAYIPRMDTVFICQSNLNRNYRMLVETLRHEGWHVVQYKCNKYRAAFSDEEIRPHLRKTDQFNLHSYHPRQQRAEAEARMIQQVPTEAWIRGVRAYC